MLAKNEIKHYNALSEMKYRTPKVPDSSVLLHSQNIFEQMREKNEFSVPNLSDIGLYKKTQELEEKSQEYYIDKSKEMKIEGQKALLLQFSEEEKKHFLLL